MKYELLDCGALQKLERFGEIVLARPCSQAVWKPTLSQTEWKKADASFTREPSNKWMGRLPKSWAIEHAGIRLKLVPTDFGHVGCFPEHAMLWSWMEKRLSQGSSLLNLFAYTGGATLAAAKTGSEVCHVDASKVAVSWARENCSLNGLEKAPIRWIVDDVIQFLQREVRRGRKYTGVVLDPPTFGRGNKGQVFKIDEGLIEILRLVFALDPNFVILSSHTPGYTPLVLHHLLKQAQDGGAIEMGELVIPGEVPLPSGTFARWYA
jgi:23S rRNA (cytosine1962-C5)-methyltransferase